MSQDFGLYFQVNDSQFVPATSDAIISAALQCMEATNCIKQPLGNPKACKDFLALKLGSLDVEVFAVILLDSQNNFIEYREMFTGTVNQTSVYPREVVRLALNLNASAMILAHNHPSGCLTPSSADKTLTHTLRSALALIDVKVLDHIVIGKSQAYSMAENGDI